VAVVLKLENICKDFSGLEILSGISLQVQSGERHAIIGPNGAGKSTLFNVITGFYQPSKGRIFFQEKDITGWPSHRIARLGLARSFQITSVFPKMTVYENVRGAVVSKLNRRFNWTSLLARSKEVQTETDRIIDLLRLGGVRHMAAMEMSYGWQRRLEVALTLARDPNLILLDEPTAGVDVKETRAFVQFIKEVTVGRTLVMIEHDMDVVYNLADHITVLNRGQVLTTGTMDEIRKNPEVQKAYAGRK
jgi:branched-chain amino acid transport system ATP-binding protein